MKLSQYFLPILKEDPAEAHVISHKLMLRAGMIRQQNSGIYSWLPLGLKVLQRISDIVRDEMNKAGINEICMPCIQPADFWVETGRYESYGKEMLKIKDRHDNDLLFGPTAEDAITDLVRNNVKSYKSLPLNLYQIQWKFRDEIRPRFGLMRGREFLMKDAYSFDIDQESANHSYNKYFETYLKIFKRVSVKAIPVKAETGPIGGNMSHEFQIIAESGESGIFYEAELDNLLDRADNYDIEKIKSLYAASDEVHNQDDCPIPITDLKNTRGIEIGHIFNFGTKYTKAMNCVVQDSQGKLVHPICGSYGIGVSRFVAAIIEASHDEKGIIWPQSVTPFDVSIICLNNKKEETVEIANRCYTELSKNYDVLFDDTSESAGSKFATHDLIGIPIQVVVGPRLAKEGMVEVRYRDGTQSTEIKIDQLNDLIQKY